MPAPRGGPAVLEAGGTLVDLLLRVGQFTATGVSGDRSGRSWSCRKLATSNKGHISLVYVY